MRFGLLTAFLCPPLYCWKRGARGAAIGVGLLWLVLGVVPGLVGLVITAIELSMGSLSDGPVGLAVGATFWVVTAGLARWSAGWPKVAAVAASGLVVLVVLAAVTT